MSLNDVKEWLYGCSRCGSCKEVVSIYLPSCPAGERFQLESYFPSGKIAIGRAVAEGQLDLADEDIRERIYACTACRSCEQQCGVYHHQHIFEIIQAVRAEAVTQGLLNPAYMVMVDSLKKDDNVFGKPKAERADWAKGLNIKDASREKVEVLYHVGCMLSFDPELWGVQQDTIAILNAAGVNYGIMGKEESCCGGRAYETGYFGEYTKYAEHFLETVNSLGVKQVVTSCSDGYATFRSLYPKLDKPMHFEVLHITEYLDRLIKEGKLKFSRSVPLKVTYHDPCHLARHVSPGVFEPPRNVLKSIPGIEVVEMERNMDNAWCCGAGGGVSQANPDFTLWTANERLQEAKATGARALVTGCPWCIRNFKDAAKKYGQEIDIYDIAEIARKAI